MKQKVYMIMLFLSSIIVVSCNPEKKTSSETVRNLNPSEEPLQETPIYKHVEIIKLETSPVSLISNVNRIEMMILLYSYQNLENCIHSQEKVNLYLKLVEKEKDRKNILS